jgi:hypothetical protein
MRSLRRHEIGGRPLLRPEKAMIMAIWRIGSFGVRAKLIGTIKRQESRSDRLIRPGEHA